MSRYKAYPAYRDTETKWLGVIPSNWNLFDGKRLFSSRRESAREGDEQLAASQKYGVVPQSLMMEMNDAKVMLALKGTSSFRHVGKNDFVISLRSFEGGIEHSSYVGCVSPAYTVLQAEKSVAPAYFKYLLKSGPYIAALQASTDSLRDGKSISYEQFGAISLPYPMPEEQAAIAAFLDYETAKIDALIEKQQRLIELLKEKRQAVISHAVTKGLNPNAPMKDSGVEWLGEVPAHWVIANLRWFIQIASGDGLSNTVIESELDQENPYKVIGGNGVMGYSKYLNTVDEAFAIGRVGALCGNVHFINYPCWVTDNALKLTNWKNFYPHYLNFLLLAARLNEYANRSAQPLITGEQVKALIVTIPPYEEQVAIANYISKELDSFSKLMDRCQSAIQMMQERRTALISAAVTGKIDVRDWQAAA